MRTRVFMEEMKMIAGRVTVSASGRKPEVAEEDEHDDGVTRHIMGFRTYQNATQDGGYRQ